METPFLVHRNRSAAPTSAIDPRLHAGPIRGTGRGTKNSTAKRHPLRAPKSQRSLSPYQLAENEQPPNTSQDLCLILPRRNFKPESHLFSTKHDGGRIVSRRWTYVATKLARYQASWRDGLPCTIILKRPSYIP